MGKAFRGSVVSILQPRGSGIDLLELINRKPALFPSYQLKVLELKS
jgi:hypothetical protein